MHSPETRDRLEHCRRLLGSMAMPSTLDGLALDLIEHLLRLHEARSLTPAFLKLSLQAFEDVQALAPVLAPLAEIARTQAEAEGHREDQGRSRWPWVVSNYSPLVR